MGSFFSVEEKPQLFPLFFMEMFYIMSALILWLELSSSASASYMRKEGDKQPCHYNHRKDLQ